MISYLFDQQRRDVGRHCPSTDHEEQFPPLNQPHVVSEWISLGGSNPIGLPIRLKSNWAAYRQISSDLRPYLEGSSNVKTVDLYSIFTELPS